MSDKHFIDTNILVYAHDSATPDKQKKAQEVIFEGLRNGTGVISTQVLSEFYVTVTKKIKKPLSSQAAGKEVLLLSRLETVDVDRSLIFRAIEIEQKWHLNYWDALIVAAAEAAECARLISEDFHDGRKFGSLHIQHIF
jgi:predicted nucleic acid-binding protein